MIERLLYDVAFSSEWGRQMRFITGPRQVGKTTLARVKLDRERSPLYYLWDLRAVRQRYKQNELFFTEDALNPTRELWVCFDEIHKVPKWKNILKATFDETGDRYSFVVTGSAKLNLLRRAGDSLAGRYFTFQLFPLMLEEVIGTAGRGALPIKSSIDFIERQLGGEAAPMESLRQLLEFSGFPEPFQRGSRPFHKKWTRDYADAVIREDIGSLTKIVDREYLFDLYSLLPEMVGSPVSESSLASHIQVSPVTAKNYLRRLSDFYLTFCIRPYSNNIKRSLLRSGKHYLFDWTRIQDEGARFENYVACELWARVSLWSEVTGENYSLWYIRNRQKEETDFLVVQDGDPWLMVESKLTDRRIEGHHLRAREALGGVPFVQVCCEPEIACMQKRGVYRISANRLFR